MEVEEREKEEAVAARAKAKAKRVRAKEGKRGLGPPLEQCRLGKQKYVLSDPLIFDYYLLTYNCCSR